MVLDHVNMHPEYMVGSYDLNGCDKSEETDWRQGDLLGRRCSHLLGCWPCSSLLEAISLYLFHHIVLQPPDY